VGLGRLAAEARGRWTFAGGTVVHISAGVSALVAAWFLGPRRDYRRVPIAPHKRPARVTGGGLLWFGWFGFNAGSALAANGLAALGVREHQHRRGRCARHLGRGSTWRVPARSRRSAPRPVSSLVSWASHRPPDTWTPMSGLLIGVLAAAVSYTAIQIRSRTKLDDALDVSPATGSPERRGRS